MGRFLGTVESFDKIDGLYRVRYDDGDIVHMSEDEVRSHVVGRESSDRRSRKSRRDDEDDDRRPRERSRRRSRSSSPARLASGRSRRMRGVARRSKSTRRRRRRRSSASRRRDEETREERETPRVRRSTSTKRRRTERKRDRSRRRSSSSLPPVWGRDEETTTYHRRVVVDAATRPASPLRPLGSKSTAHKRAPLSDATNTTPVVSRKRPQHASAQKSQQPRVVRFVESSSDFGGVPRLSGDDRASTTPTTIPPGRECVPRKSSSSEPALPPQNAPLDDQRRFYGANDPRHAGTTSTTYDDDVPVAIPFDPSSYVANASSSDRMVKTEIPSPVAATYNGTASLRDDGYFVRPSGEQRNGSGRTRHAGRRLDPYGRADEPCACTLSGCIIS